MFRRAGITALAVVFAMASSAWANDTQSNSQQNDQQSSQATDQQAQSQNQQQAPEGYVLVSERIVYLLADQPQQHFVAALARMNENNPNAAAAELRLASNYLDLQASRAQSKNKEALGRDSKELKSLAKKVAQNDKSIKADQLSQCFSMANADLAELFQTKADQALQKKQFVRAGHDLNNAATSLRQAMTWSKQEPQQETAQVIDNAHTVAANLMSEHVKGKASSGEEGKAGKNLNSQNGTTNAEAANTVQHAQKVSQALAKQIDQLQGSEAQTAGYQQQNPSNEKSQNQSSSENQQNSKSQSQNQKSQ